jgi:hypothetical protein
MVGVAIGAGIATGDIIGAGDIVTVAGEEVSLGDEIEEPRTKGSRPQVRLPLCQDFSLCQDCSSTLANDPRLVFRDLLYTRRIFISAAENFAVLP